ncbi:tripartite motif-containing protein 16-like [Silurus meridionalis]|nr:tripartite motif-containing protein 16-like [Silurus meridionalis]
MAEARVSVNLVEFNCSICLDLLTDPVSVPCGHSFCKSCINRQWDGEVLNRVYSCPLCKQHFSPRPILGRNIMLAEMVEKLKKTCVSERTLAGPEDVECDVCIRHKHKAVKSCLVCVASYCQVHFEMHNELHPENTHKVIESRYSLKDRICSVHKKPKDVICSKTEQFFCPECVDSYCLGHDTTTVTKKRYQEQFQIEHIQTDVLQRAQAAENSIKDLKKALNTIKISAKTALDQTEKLFAELIRSAERKRSEIKGIIKATEEAEVHRAEKILHFLEQELTELKERDKKLVQLSNLEDDFLFVKTSMSLFNLATFSDAPQFTVNLTPFKEIQNSVSELEIKCKEFCMSELSPGSRAAVNRCHMIQASVPIFREDFLQYFQQLTVDTRTSHRDLQLSEGNRNITFDDSKPNNTQKPESFDYYSQTLCREALQKRCYWEVEWGGQQVYIAASYRGVERKGCFTSIGFGFNDKSWSLRCNSSQFTFFHDSYKKVISGPVSRRIGIYLDHRAGTLSFYSITDTMKLLHRVRTYFTEPLYGGFWVFDDSSVKICGKNEKLPSQTQITPVSASFHGYQFQFEE